jgi:hypothetical protein
VRSGNRIRRELAALEDEITSLGLSNYCPVCGGRPGYRIAVWESDTEPDECSECGRWVNEHGDAIEEGYLDDAGCLHFKRIILRPGSAP